MLLTREEIFEKFEQSFKNSKDRNITEEIELSLEYHLNENYVLEKFIEFYERDIKDYQERFAKERKNITKLITAISLTKTNTSEKIEKLPFLKTIDVFDKVNTIYFLYTKESEKKFLEIKKYYENSKIEIKGQLIDKDKNIDLDLDSDEYIEKLFANERDFDEIVEYLDFRDSLAEDNYTLVYLKGYTLYLRKFGIEIDLKNEIDDIFFKSGSGKVHAIAIPIIRLLKEGNNSYDLRDLEGNKWTKATFAKNKTILKNKIMVNLNNLIRKKLRDRNYEEEDFIEEVFEGTGSAKKYSSFLKIKINDYFLDYK